MMAMPLLPGAVPLPAPCTCVRWCSARY